MELGPVDRGALVTLWVYGSVKGDEAHWSSLEGVVLLLAGQGFHDAEWVPDRLVAQGWLDVEDDGVRVHDWGVWQPQPPKTSSQRQKEWREKRRGYSREEVFARDGMRCRYGYDTVDLVTGVLEHVIPVGRPGSHEPDNIVTSCRSCNKRKGARTPAEAGMPLLAIPSSAIPGRLSTGVQGLPPESAG
jgi:hypothetical protein